jgi:septal ring factor EnvC (AmiA/AmiB activator)
MTTTHRNFGQLASLAALFLALLVCTSAVQAVEASPSLSKKELKALSASPSGHERLAAYYRERAQHLRAKAQEFSAQADYLATQPATIESKQGISCNCTSHYRYFSKLYAREAKDAETLAARQEQLAQEYQSKSTESTHQ